MTTKRLLQQKYVEDFRAENAELRPYIKDKYELQRQMLEVKKQI